MSMEPHNCPCGPPSQGAELVNYLSQTLTAPSIAEIDIKVKLQDDVNTKHLGPNDSSKVIFNSKIS